MNLFLIHRLKLQVGKDGEDFVCSSLAEIANLRERLLLKELEMKEMSKTWQEKVLRSEEKKMEESRVLERAGIAFKVNHFINLIYSFCVFPFVKLNSFPKKEVKSFLIPILFYLTVSLTP